MKKIILTIAAVFAFGVASAQDLKYGAKAGLDLLSAKYDGAGSVSATGFYVGGFVEFGIADKFALQPGVNYHAASKEGVDFNYISIPVLAKYNVAEKFNLLAGPSLFYSMDSEDNDKTRFNLDLGASYDITENLFVDPRYSLGLTGDVKVSHFLIGLGYRF
ncbi:porin family protein [Flavobacterium capsici]|uniref:Porin family protein n=1 Tax=Flavobacterium capsici TaxID=3075618 RepID=A0AA96J2E1_9FLAO|nr:MULTISPECIES: porin family protein [unclassified Flavobacterium]WNM19005.1 porin family protein [Flavobacterium sp. PMR2A8]WNM23055.1 porin family protein [Flavobacterium sp. PMTSA4]